ncbi:protein-methionine-sulfoxide reductase catalytic subunit MsrP [Kushneria pakistanensis]|uniref:Protein-methionine-sulfoxide reductase catalytic subunit MsrP n=1 Tax=Kushneria pakistanensis TaxID=1508770 RepID=A0ABQ3FCT6_9GAMM|nr:protein-methionine-sulfoxide reductase catalytic subunit MsrP [Kushneria pakistanensis]GHC18950.1 protein-methionine-sulfoxide reductase catalytic subunit MsrP [Kushneria pakistanensis]
MLLKTRKRHHIGENEVTSESVYHARRHFMAGVAGLGMAAALPRGAWAASHYDDVEKGARPEWFASRLEKAKWEAVTAGDSDKLTPFNDASHYNNFFEFGTSKDDPYKRAGAMTTEPWTIEIDGEVARPGTLNVDQLLGEHQLEERIYRLRCVEAWSMVIPWLGVPLSAILKRAEPTSDAKFVRFQTLMRPEEMPGQRSRFGLIDWPYQEGLRMDEAMHPLTLLSVGMYGRVLPNQNGAPVRLVVPWKYGFKSIKSIVRISLVKEQPSTAWPTINANEYGFYSNVNPEVDHPRWSQARERRLPNSLFSTNMIDTQMFNGYGEEVASLYKGMDLRKYF